MLPAAHSDKHACVPKRLLTLLPMVCAGWLESTPAVLQWLLEQQPADLASMAHPLFVLSGNVIGFVGASESAVSQPAFLSFCDKMMTISRGYLQCLSHSSSSSSTATINTASNKISTDGTAISTRVASGSTSITTSSSSTSSSTSSSRTTSRNQGQSSGGNLIISGSRGAIDLRSMIVFCQGAVLTTICSLATTSALPDEHPLLSNVAVAEAATALMAAACQSAHKQHTSKQREGKKAQRRQRLNQEQAGSMKAVSSSISASKFSELLLHPDHNELLLVGVEDMIEYGFDKVARIRTVAGVEFDIWWTLSRVVTRLWRNKTSVLSRSCSSSTDDNRSDSGDSYGGSSSMDDGDHGSLSKDLTSSGNGKKSGSSKSSSRGNGVGIKAGSRDDVCSGASSSSRGGGGTSSSSSGDGTSSSSGGDGTSSSSGDVGGTSSSSGDGGGTSSSGGGGGNGEESCCSDCTNSSRASHPSSRSAHVHALIASFPLAFGEGLLLKLEAAALMGAGSEGMSNDADLEWIGIGLC